MAASPTGAFAGVREAKDGHDGGDHIVKMRLVRLHGQAGFGGGRGTAARMIS